MEEKTAGPDGDLKRGPEGSPDWGGPCFVPTMIFKGKSKSKKY